MEIDRKGLEEIVKGFKKRQDEKLKRLEKKVIDQFHLALSNTCPQSRHALKNEDFRLHACGFTT